MPNIQQPEMRRSEQTPLVQESKGPPAAGSNRPRKERRRVPTDQLSPHGPAGKGGTESDEPKGRPAQGD